MLSVGSLLTKSYKILTRVIETTVIYSKVTITLNNLDFSVISKTTPLVPLKIKVKCKLIDGSTLSSLLNLFYHVIDQLLSDSINRIGLH